MMSIREKTHKKAEEIVEYLCDYYESNPDMIKEISEPNDLKRSVCDWIAGMTDEYAITTYRTLNKF